MKTVTIEGQDYTLGRIKVGVARDAQFRAKTGMDFNISIVAASLQAGGLADANEAWVDANIDFFGAFPALLAAACEVNGLTGTARGENQPETGPASTSTISTAQ